MPDQRARAATSRPSWKALAALGLASRLAVLVVGLLLAHRDHQPAWLIDRDLALRTQREATNARQLEQLSVGNRRWIEPWYRWDAIWYAEISERGYSYQPGQQSSVAFLPLLPVVMRAGAAAGLDRYWVGLAVPNIAFTIGLVLFGELVWRVTGDRGAAWRACLLLVAYPWSFVFSAPYQESLMFVLTAAAILAWLAGRPLQSAASAALSSAARLAALAFPVALAADWLESKLRRRPAVPAALPVALAGFAGAAAFVVYLGVHFDDPLVLFKAQAAWGRGHPSPANLLHAFAGFVHEPETAGVLLKNALTVAFLLLGARAWRRGGVFWAALTWVPVLQGLSTGSTLSISRLILSAYPAFLDAGELLRRRTILILLVAACLVVQVLLIDRYVNWHFPD
jgi:Mannosyltransferase (PIG-V)